MKLLHKTTLSAMLAASLGVAAFGSSVARPTEDQRDALIQEITSTWSGHANRLHGISESQWRANMLSTFETADIANLERAAEAESFESMNAALFGRTFEDDYAGREQESIGILALGATDRDLVFTPLEPCRILDTRVTSEGRLAARETRDYSGWTDGDFTDQGGHTGNCGIPANASALVMNIIAVGPETPSGHLTVYPSDAPQRPNASTVNFVAGSNVVNQAIIPLCRGTCASDFRVFAWNPIDVVIDVSGYFMEPEATALDCTVATDSGNLSLIGGLQTRSIQCPTGYTATGGGCGGPLGITISNSRPLITEGSPSGWQCDLVGSLLSIISYEVHSTCCRVPGR